jgi:hypothetical protein
MTILLQRVRLKWVCGIEVEQIRRKCNRAQRAPAFDSAEVRFAQDDKVFGEDRKKSNGGSMGCGRCGDLHWS